MRTIAETTRAGKVPKDMKEYGIEGLGMSQKRPGGNGRDQLHSRVERRWCT